MNLNDPRIIEQTMNTSVPEVEVLYWIIEDSLYKGKQSRAKSVLILLLYLAKYRNDLIQSGLKEVQRLRVKSLCYEFFGNGPVVQQQSITMKPATQLRQIPFKTEKELQKYLVLNKHVLIEILGSPIRIVGTEVETDNNYRCDIVVENQDTLYAIELKIVQGDHSVVSQCSKYCFYFYRTLRYNMFKNVQGIIIAPGYDAWSINELRRQGHWVYTIATNDKNITLEKIHNN